MPIATLTITAASTGSLSATGGDNAAGIGGGSGGAGGNITITGGSVTATGGYGGAGIGGGGNSGGGSGPSGTFKTQADGSAPGNAFIIASSISNTSGKTSTSNPWSGLIFESNSTNGQVYGNPVLSADSTIPAGKTLNVPTGKTLTVPSGRALVVASGATLDIDTNGTVQNEGIIYKYGTVNGSVSGTIYPQSGNANPVVHLGGTSVYLQENASGENQISYTNTPNYSWQTYTGTVTLTGTTDTYTVTVLSGTHDVDLNGVNIEA